MIHYLLFLPHKVKVVVLPLVQGGEDPSPQSSCLEGASPYPQTQVGGGGGGGGARGLNHPVCQDGPGGEADRGRRLLLGRGGAGMLLLLLLLLLLLRSVREQESSDGGRRRAAHDGGGQGGEGGRLPGNSGVVRSPEKGKNKIRLKKSSYRAASE